MGDSMIIGNLLWSFWSNNFVCVIISKYFQFSKGYFVQPTIVETKDPLDKIMTEEIFGPLLSVYVYKDSEVDKTVDLVTSSTPYALTGAVFAEDKLVVKLLFKIIVYVFIVFCCICLETFWKNLLKP